VCDTADGPCEDPGVCDGGGGPCPPGTLCLLGNRFRVTATWQNQYDGSSGDAGVQKASDLSGYLYFTDPRNTELIVKILDFGDVIKVFWPAHQPALHDPVEDTHRDTTRPTATPRRLRRLRQQRLPVERAWRQWAPCGQHRGRRRHRHHVPASRFAVEMTWRNQYDGSSGSGLPKKLTDLTGAFGFTDTANLEVLVKTLDFGDRILVLYGALSDLEYDLRVTDTGSVGRTCPGSTAAA
jgi:hypothetical protein